MNDKTRRNLPPRKDKTIRNVSVGTLTRKDKTLRKIGGAGFLDTLKSFGSSLKEIATSQNTIDNIYKPLANKGIELLANKIKGQGMYDGILKAQRGVGRYKGKGEYSSLLSAQAGVGRRKKKK